MKHCKICNTDKHETDFHIRKASKDGLAARCKDCQRKYDKSRADNKERAEARKAYQKTERGKAAAEAAKKRWAEKNKDKLKASTKRYRSENPKKYKAHGKVAYEIKMGNLVPEPCEICGDDKKIQAHHDDYDKPLNVRWLCAAHHRQWHIENGEGANAS